MQTGAFGAPSLFGAQTSPLPHEPDGGVEKLHAATRLSKLAGENVPPLGGQLPASGSMYADAADLLSQ